MAITATGFRLAFNAKINVIGTYRFLPGADPHHPLRRASQF
ncbi:MAG: hypothetical protein ABI583_06105 [Betaproteobacteria bacterium]